MNEERENLIEELKANLECVSFIELRYERIADWIIADRKKICEPLIKFQETSIPIGETDKYACEAIEETLNRAGLENWK